MPKLADDYQRGVFDLIRDQKTVQALGGLESINDKIVVNNILYEEGEGGRTLYHRLPESLKDVQKVEANVATTTCETAAAEEVVVESGKGRPSSVTSST